MGNYVTKLLFHTNESQKENNELQAVKQQIATDNNMCTPTLSERKMILCDPRSVSAGIARTPIEMHDSSMCTPTLPEKRVLCDPRSISAGISRTPIEVKCTPVTVIKRAPNAIPQYLQKKKYLETDMDVVMPPLTPKKCFVPKLIDSDQKLELDRAQDYLMPNMNVVKSSKQITPIDQERYTILGLDPRSPAADFDRTPILMPKSLALIKARSQETLSRRGSYESDIYNPTNSHQQISTSLSIPKIQLLPDTVSERPKTLDVVKQNESHIFYTSQQSDSDSSDIEVIESEEEVTVIKNPKCKNEKEESLISGKLMATEKETNKDDTDKKDNCKNIKYDMKTIHIKDDNEITVWHDSVSSEENITGKRKKENIVEKLPQKKAPREDIIIMFDEYATISTLPKSIKTEEDCQKKGDIAERKKKSTKIDPAVTTNEKKIFTPENKMHGIEMLKNRTPFGNRSNNDQVHISSPQHLSRNKAISTKTQQENTPPYKMYNAKTKNGYRWDSNITVFI